MGQQRRAVHIVGGACLALAGLALIWPSEPAGSDFAQDRCRGDDLDHLMSSLRCKRALKDAVYDDLFAGRLSLTDAVDRCEAIEGQFPELAETFRHGLRVFQPGRTDRERLAHSAI